MQKQHGLAPLHTPGVEMLEQSPDLRLTTVKHRGIQFLERLQTWERTAQRIICWRPVATATLETDLGECSVKLHKCLVTIVPVGQALDLGHESVEILRLKGFADQRQDGLAEGPCLGVFGKTPFRIEPSVAEQDQQGIAALNLFIEPALPVLTH
ncbi:MAG: hypothetical protein NTW83_04665, partial [Cyanobacteria bacterium]|nr:hypothetical protein [Cyanobacteriota bacterium]